jgi:predicted RNase H-like HicB family nuclease
MVEMKSYTVTYERDENGLWVAEIQSVQGCFTQGRTIEQARERIREALGLFIGEKAKSAALQDDVKLPAQLTKRLEAARKARSRAEVEAQQAAEKSREVALALTSEGLSLRDVGTLLGITRQGAHKLTA